MNKKYMSKAEEIHKEMQTMEFFKEETAELSKAYEEYKKAAENYLSAYENYEALIQTNLSKKGDKTHEQSRGNVHRSPIF